MQESNASMLDWNHKIKQTTTKNFCYDPVFSWGKSNNLQITSLLPKYMPCMNYIIITNTLLYD